MAIAYSVQWTQQEVLFVQLSNHDTVPSKRCILEKNDYEYISFGKCIP
jgi:hypothetical protein